jgi:hypothetical protein
MCALVISIMLFLLASSVGVCEDYARTKADVKKRV